MQLEQLAAPAEEYFPVVPSAAQVRHAFIEVAAEEAEYFPAAQFVQVVMSVASVAVEYVPAAHAVRVFLSGQ